MGVPKKAQNKAMQPKATKAITCECGHKTVLPKNLKASCWKCGRLLN